MCNLKKTKAVFDRIVFERSEGEAIIKKIEQNQAETLRKLIGLEIMTEFKLPATEANNLELQKQIS